jgi:hypothetical protein
VRPYKPPKPKGLPRTELDALYDRDPLPEFPMPAK